MTPEKLILSAVNAEDLAIIATLCQDALVTVKDVSFQDNHHQLIFILNRFCWEKDIKTPPFSRTHSALVFEHITSVKSHNFKREEPDTIYQLLTIAPLPDSATPQIQLRFSKDTTLILSAKKLICSLQDLGEPWPTQWQPNHTTA